MKADRKELLGILKAVKPSVPKSGDDADIVNTVIFTGTDVVAFARDGFIAWPFTTDFQAAMPINELIKLLTSKAEEVTLDLAKGMLSVTGKGMRAGLKIPVISHLMADVKGLMSIVEGEPWYGLPDDFIQGLSLCMNIADKGSAWDHRRNVHITSERITASSGARVAEYVFAEAMGIPGVTLLSVENSKRLVKLKKENVNRYRLDGNWLVFLTESDVVMGAKVLYDLPLDPIADIFQKAEAESKTYTLPDGVADQVPLAKIMASNSPYVSVSLEKGKVVLTGDGVRGWSEAVLDDPDFAPEPEVVFSINAEFLIEVLGYTSNEVRLSATMAIFAQENYRHVIALVR